MVRLPDSRGLLRKGRAQRRRQFHLRGAETIAALVTGVRNRESVTLGLRKVLERPNKRIEAVYFRETGFASVVAVQRGGKEVEVGLIGREGMTGLPIVLGNHRSPHAIYYPGARRARSADRDGWTFLLHRRSVGRASCYS
jgi:CRP-like cAMP-binding protein